MTPSHSSLTQEMDAGLISSTCTLPDPRPSIVPVIKDFGKAAEAWPPPMASGAQRKLTQLCHPLPWEVSCRILTAVLTQRLRGRPTSPCPVLSPLFLVSLLICPCLAFGIDWQGKE